MAKLNEAEAWRLATCLFTGLAGFCGYIDDLVSADLITPDVAKAMQAKVSEEKARLHGDQRWPASFIWPTSAGKYDEPRVAFAKLQQEIADRAIAAEREAKRQKRARARKKKVRRGK